MTSRQAAPLPAPDEDTRRLGTQTLLRGLDLLELAIEKASTPAELAKRSGLSRAVTYRLVGTLVSRGFLERTSAGRYRGGRSVLRLGHLAGDSHSLLAQAILHLESLSDTTGLSSFLGRREGDMSLHLLRVPGRERISVTTTPGTRRPLAETGMGKALMLEDGSGEWQRLLRSASAGHRHQDWLRQMERAARAGVVFQFGPPPDSINSVAVPVRDKYLKIVAAINIAAPAQYLERALMVALAPLLVQTSLAISRDLLG